MRFNRPWRHVLLLSALLLGSGAVWGQGIKIGVVNFGRLLEEAPQSQASQRALQEEFAPRQREIRPARRSSRSSTNGSSRVRDS